MSWSRRRVLSGLAAAPWALAWAGPTGCAVGTEQRPPRTPRGVEVALPSIVHGSLAAGPGLYLVEDHGLPLVAVAVAVAAGHRHERPGEEGRASLATALLLEGMEGGDRVALLERYGELGTTPTASAGPSQVVVRCTVHRDDAPAALQLLLDNLRRPTSDSEAFERVRREQREAMRAVQGEPEVVAGLGLVLGSHGVDPPSATFAGGTAESIDAATLEQVHAWLPPRLRLDGLTFMMAGDVDQAQALRWIDAAIEGWPPAQGPRPVSPPPLEAIPEPARPRVVLVRWPEQPQAIMALGGPREPLGHAAEPAQALADALMAGMMQYELRSRQRISYGIQSRSWTTKVGAVEQLWAKLEPGEVGRAVQALWSYLERLEGEVVLRDEPVDEVRRAAMVGLMHDFHGAESSLGQLRGMVEHGLSGPAPVERFRRLQALRTDEVTAALRHVYRPDRVRLCVVGDDAVIERARAVLPDDGVVVRTPAQLLGLPEGTATPARAPGPAEVCVARALGPQIMIR
ncbi:MAG: insulinase family protein [Myxococcales bacterium]|nr:insulinase family protein [Myxococcales bacterium]